MIPEKDRTREISMVLIMADRHCMRVDVSGRGPLGTLPNMAAKRESQRPLPSEVRTSGHRLISITIGDIPHLEWVFAV